MSKNKRSRYHLPRPDDQRRSRNTATAIIILAFLICLTSILGAATAAPVFVPTDASLHGGRYYVESDRQRTLGGYVTDFAGFMLNGKSFVEISALCANIMGYPGAVIATVSEFRAGAAYLVDHPSNTGSTHNLLLLTDEGKLARWSYGSIGHPSSMGIIEAPIDVTDTRGVLCSFPYCYLEGPC